MRERLEAERPRLGQGRVSARPGWEGENNARTWVDPAHGPCERADTSAVANASVSIRSSRRADTGVVDIRRATGLPSDGHPIHLGQPGTGWLSASGGLVLRERRMDAAGIENATTSCGIMGERVVFVSTSVVIKSFSLRGNEICEGRTCLLKNLSR